MKQRILLWITALACCFALAACDSQDPALESGSDPASTEAATTFETQPSQETTVESTPETEPETNAPALDGSFTTPLYSVSVQDGAYYLKFTDEGTDAPASGNNESLDESLIMAPSHISFRSLAEMKQKLTTGDLTEQQMQIMRSKFRKTEQGIEICNTQALLQPVTPAGYQIESVYLSGTKYDFAMKSDQSSLLMEWGDADKWERSYEQWKEYYEIHQVDTHETGTFETAPCETYVYTTSSARIKHIYITLPAEGDDAPTQIRLEYILEHFEDLLPESDTLPLTVYIAGETDGVPFYYSLTNLTQAPTLAWLSTFSIEPYVDSVDSVDHLAS